MGEKKNRQNIANTQQDGGQDGLIYFACVSLCVINLNIFLPNDYKLYNPQANKRTHT